MTTLDMLPAALNGSAFWLPLIWSALLAIAVMALGAILLGAALGYGVHVVFPDAFSDENASSQAMAMSSAEMPAVPHPVSATTRPMSPITGASPSPWTTPTKRLPSLLTLDAMNFRAVVFGWACLTVGVAAGVWWASQASGIRVQPGNAQWRSRSTSASWRVIAS